MARGDVRIDVLADVFRELEALLRSLFLGELTGPWRAALAPTLAVFHTTFNLLGVVLMWPLSARLVKDLERRWVTKEEERGTPRERTSITSKLKLRRDVLDFLTCAKMECWR